MYEMRPMTFTEQKKNKKQKNNKKSKRDIIITVTPEQKKGKRKHGWGLVKDHKLFIA